MMDARTFEAGFNGPCAAQCGEPIEAGQEVTWQDDGSRQRVAHAGCLIVVEKRAGEACNRCFTERAVNGSCACEE